MVLSDEEAPLLQLYAMSLVLHTKVPRSAKIADGVYSSSHGL